jgi:maleylacetate reductase
VSVTGPAPFVYQALPMRVRFGAGSARDGLAEEVAALGLTSVLALCSPGHRSTTEAVVASIGDRCVGVLAEARMHVPVEVAERARAEADRLGADGFVAVGGGSAIGLGKAIALTSGRPIIAVPTTYAGSEMTPVWGLTQDGAKQTGRDPKVLPRSVIYDAELTLDLPVAISVTSGMNAIAHAAEALYATDISPVIALMANEGIRSLVTALPAIAATPTDLAARSSAQYAAWLCGACLGATTMSLHHKICHALGGAADLPHAATHTVVLPYVLAYNLSAVPAVEGRLSGLFDGRWAPMALWELAGRLGAPRTLQELGLAEGDIGRVADQVTATAFANPRPVTRDAVATIVHQAWSGGPPSR